MRLNELIDKIEAAGFTLIGDRTFADFPFPVAERKILVAPVVLIPREPPVRSECVMIADLLTWSGDWRGKDGSAIQPYVRIEGGAALDGGTVVYLQFVKKEQA